jgi:O-antigen ligase
VTGDPHKPSPSPLEFAVAGHVMVFLVGVSWAFGGNADWVRTPVSIWGSVGMLLTLALVARRNTRERIIAGTLPWAWPVVILNLVVAVSCLTPNFKHLALGGGGYLMPVRVAWWIPSSARQDVALRSLWLFDGIFFSCLNMALAFSRRGIIRIVLAVAVGNSLALSVFGTVQKLVGATGIYFGAVKSPQDYFFASFVYDNHWGAFTLLMLGACVGLILRYATGRDGGGFFHGPAFAGLVAALLIGLSIPLSGSRACTLMLGILAVDALLQGIPRLSRALRLSGSPAAASLAIILATAAAAGVVWMVAGESILARAQKTREQVASMLSQRGMGARSVLYRDTWRMARERPVFGWGMGSFPTVFALYNTQEPNSDRIPVVYHDAHSDWIQCVAEIGLAGTALIGSAVLLPFSTARRSRLTPLPRFLLAGCTLTALYAWVEFPFGNVAVVLAWWLCFFGAIQYMRLSGAPQAPVRTP